MYIQNRQYISVGVIFLLYCRFLHLYMNRRLQCSVKYIFICSRGEKMYRKFTTEPLMVGCNKRVVRGVHFAILPNIIITCVHISINEQILHKSLLIIYNIFGSNFNTDRITSVVLRGNMAAITDTWRWHARHHYSN